jgi:acetyltransferase (GNAT) family protein
VNARIDLPKGLTSRSPAFEDARAVHELYATCDRAVTVETESFDPSLQLVIVARGGEIVGTANTIDPAAGGEGWVHQLAVAHEHRGLVSGVRCCNRRS